MPEKFSVIGEIEMEKKGEKGLSRRDYFFMGFGANLGVGWSVSVGSWMLSAGGVIPAALGFLISFVFIGPVALCYCELSPMLPVAGGSVAYSYRAFGEKASFVAGWVNFGAFITLIPWEAIYLTNILSYLFPILKEGKILYTFAGEEIYLGTVLIGVVFSTLLYLLNRRGANASAKVQNILCKTLIVAGFMTIVLGLIGGSADNLLPIYERAAGSAGHNSFLGGTFSIVFIAAFYICGFETIPQSIEESKGDFKDVGKMVLLSVIAACSFYSLIVLTVGLGNPWQETALLPPPVAANVFLYMFDGWLGKVAWAVVMLGTLCGLFATWNAFMMASPRVLMSLARVSMVPKVFAKQNPRTGVPTVGLNICLLFALAGPFLGLGVIDALTSFGAAAFLLSWGFAAASLIRLRKTEPELPRPYRIPGGVKTAWFALLCVTALFVMCFIPGSACYMGDGACIFFVVWLALGIALFALNTGERRNISPEVRKSTMFAGMRSGSDVPSENSERMQTR